MKIARVIGRLTLSKKVSAYAAARFVILSPLSKEQLANEDNSKMSSKVNLVSYDCLGVTMGDIVGYVDGAEAAAAFDKAMPVDAYIVALFDNINYRPEAE